MKNILLTLILLIGASFFYSCEQNNQGEGLANIAKKSKKKTIILAIDGGGIKGIIPAYFLQEIEKAFEKDSLKIHQLFDVIGGTSTGGILSVALTSPKDGSSSPRSAKEVLDLYTGAGNCDEIFYENQQYFSKYHVARYGPKYFADSVGHGVEAFLKSKLTVDKTLKDASTALAALPNNKVKQVFTTSYLVNSKGGNISKPKMGVDFGPYLFNWFDAKNDASHNYYLWEAARSTSAAPTYFPIANVGGDTLGRSPANEKWAIDGGVMSNDPAIWGITESFRAEIATSIDDIIIISLGCGLDRPNGGFDILNAAPNDKKGQKYGFWSTGTWTAPQPNLDGDIPSLSPAILNIITYANQFVPATQLENLAAHTGLQYIRIQPELPVNLTPMDKCANVDALVNFATQYYKNDGKAQLDKAIALIKANQ